MSIIGKGLTRVLYTDYDACAISRFDRRRVAEELDDDRCAGAHGEKYLDHLWAMYFRISEHAHLPARNDKPDAYLFGSTVIASKSEVKDFLTDIWEQPIDENKPELGFRPIILLYFNSQSKHQASSMWEQIRFDPSRMDTTIATLDCQAIAEQCKIAHNPFPALCDLLSQFDIEFYDIENCGNAAFYIIIVAMLSVLKEHLYRAPDNMQASPGQHGRSASKPAQMVMDWLMMSPTSAPPIGDHNPKYH